MPRRSSNTGDSSLTRRCSARIAATKSNETPSPAKKTRRSSNRKTENKVEYAEDEIEQNGTEFSSKASLSAEEPVKKKIKSDGSSEKLSKNTQESAIKDDLLTRNGSPSKSEFNSDVQVAEQPSLTKSDSEKVESATSAQVKDDEILADDIPAVLEKTNANKTEANSLCKGDDVGICSSTERIDATGSEQKDIESQLEKPSKEGISQ